MTRHAGTGWWRPSRGWPRTLLMCALFAIAFSWPFLDNGKWGGPLLLITPEHGVDVGDLAAILPLTLALALGSNGRRPTAPAGRGDSAADSGAVG